MNYYFFYVIFRLRSFEDRSILCTNNEIPAGSYVRIVSIVRSLSRNTIVSLD